MLNVRRPWDGSQREPASQPDRSALGTRTRPRSPHIFRSHDARLTVRRSTRTQRVTQHREPSIRASKKTPAGACHDARHGASRRSSHPSHHALTRHGARTLQPRSTADIINFGSVPGVGRHQRRTRTAKAKRIVLLSRAARSA